MVLAYVEYLEQAEAVEAATEFLVLIAALLELKSRLMRTPVDDEEGLDLDLEAAELLARMLEYHRYRQARGAPEGAARGGHGYRCRSAPLPRELRRVSIEAAERAYEPELLA